VIQPTIKTKKRYIALTTYRRLRYNIRHIKGKKNKKRAVGRQEGGRRRIVVLDHLRRRSADSRWEKKHLASSTTLNASLVLFSFQICMCCCCFHVIKSIGKREREGGLRDATNDGYFSQPLFCRLQHIYGALAINRLSVRIQ
jgi:hypothetical protein